MQFRLAVFGVGCVLLAGGSCLAATVEPTGGEVFINRGQGYQLVTGPIEANVGDAVMVNPNGSATIGYGGGCTVNVQPGAIATIAPSPPCNSSAPQQQPVAQTDPPSDAAFWLGVTGTVLGAAGLGVGIYAITQENKNSTCGATVATQCFISP